ncbi:MAG: precorrin-3B C(17)-methyltransferase [Alphaproteobacteria bacterium]|nr:precorrin-3B C(17)-methyltransferase [Alphaproteobacteria bacterium]
MSRAPVVVGLGENAVPTARRVAMALPGARFHGLAGRVHRADEYFTDAMAHLRALFEAGVPIVGVCASGVLIRALAPKLADKQTEPPVVAVAEDGSAVVPLLGGHRGANDLARRIGAVLGVAAAITTASDSCFGIALDEPPTGYTLVNPADHKSFVAALLAGAKLRVEGAAPWLAASQLPIDPTGALTIAITPRREPGGPTRLVYHPRVLAVGVGCERGAAPEEMLALAKAALADAEMAEAAVAGVYSLDLKADEPSIHVLAAAFGVPARFFPAAVLEAETPRLANPSDLVFAEVACHGVAEGAALAAAGPDAQLIVPKRKSAQATVAVAAAQTPFDGAIIGQAQGRLYVVGTGSGDGDRMTPETATLIAEATDLIGYRLYLDLLGPLAAGKIRHDFALGDEMARVQAALALAAEGRTVALVSSGDPGIYAMASLVFEVLDGAADPAWRRLALRVAPGISALQAAAARIGAPLGHDFCAISLSDLLTPWSVIERRIRAAAEGDFVIAFYNPASQRRTHQLGRARDLLLMQRRGDTPVVIARNLGRVGEQVTVATLETFDPGAIDMLTLVLVGSSSTRTVVRGDGRLWVYTPRGYAAKHVMAQAR